ncbi:conserved hypothetical protein [Ricinus communis]|uniref:Uncharacterized protein n=1 Tax=Ricinus communis TaxID=3988 RepID=B9SEU7_RICCO|nr:conserved hypothetical protein [Ricinus communis]|eukprot:XP_002524516.1 uncharacterized protein LOC8275911 [Ricinus communis]
MLIAQDLSFSKTLNPYFSFPKFLPRSKSHFISFSSPNSREVRAFAGRSKKKSGRIEGSVELHRKVKRSAQQRSKKLAESFFYRLKNPNKNYADNLSEDELNLIGLGYDRMVRFMEKDDPNIKHPYDWYKYGEFGPYSWRGVVIGDPVVGRFTDDRVTLYSEVKDQEEWEKIEQYEMEVDFGERLKVMDKSVGFRHYWVFVRHPKWRLSEKSWEQWTLVSEIVVEAGKQQRLDKWNLMGRLGNTARKLITQCAAWFRPDIIYVKRPVYQCRFEPQMDFFKALTPLLDPKTEKDFMFELKNEEDGGNIEMCSYFEGLCKIVKISQKAFVDDVVNAYEKLSEEKKSKCLEFLLRNHPVQLLHPYTKEWKAKLDEMELGCDAPDDDDEDNYNKHGNEFTEWIEDDSDNDDDNRDDFVMDMEEGGDEDELGSEVGDLSEEEDDEDEGEEEDEKLKKEMSSAEAMENLARWSVETTTELYKRQLKRMEEQEKGKVEEDGDETALRGVRAKVDPKEWEIAGIGKWRKRIRKSRIPPELFLRAAVRPFTYRNLVKEIVLTRHAILDGEIGRKE